MSPLTILHLVKQYASSEDVEFDEIPETEVASANLKALPERVTTELLSALSNVTKELSIAQASLEDYVPDWQVMCVSAHQAYLHFKKQLDVAAELAAVQARLRSELWYEVNEAYKIPSGTAVSFVKRGDKVLLWLK